MTPTTTCDPRTPDSRALIEDLHRPGAYPHAVDLVDMRATHISWLFFAGQWVYKVKRPVQLGFLDFASLERRQHFCEEEVRLNRRLTDGVYAGVVPLTRGSDGHVVVEGDGETVEWAVKMKRLPSHRMLDVLLERGEVDNRMMNSIARLLAQFHDRVPTGPGVDAFGSPESIRSNVEENFDQLAAFVQRSDARPEVAVLSISQFAFLRRKAREFLRDSQALLEDRIRRGRIREGHGDLHAENICFTNEGIAIYDCIEFSGRFRCGDVLADLAFLTMDLDDRGYPGFSKYLAWRYLQESGDVELPELEAFYKTYRALVRCKVSAMTALGAPNSDTLSLKRKAMRYGQLAAAYELPPALVLMSGLPASGKSWLSTRLARPLRASVLHSDVRRKVLAGKIPTTPAGEPYETGLYSPEMKHRTYRSLLDQALALLRAGHSVVVDATFSRSEYRSMFVDALERLELPYYIVHVVAPDATIRERLARRAKDKKETSDADLEVYLREKEAFESLDDVPPQHVLEVICDEDCIPEEQSGTLIDRMIGVERR